jgi:hypothetical protein
VACTLTPFGAVARGVVAGAAGTVAMDLLLYRRYQSGGGAQSFVEWEFSSGLDNWEDAAAPAQVGRRLFEGLLQRELPPQQARLTNNVMHWAYGIAWGAQYGLVAGSARVPRVRYGLVLGPAVWMSGYVVLPLAKLYKPAWEYDATALAKDLSGHVVYGLGTATAFRLLAALHRAKRAAASVRPRALKRRPGVGHPGPGGAG